MGIGIRITTAGGCVALVLAGVAPAQAAAPPPPRSTADACPPGALAPAGFSDVPRSSPHATAVDCVVHWQVTRGRTASTYAPRDVVTRGQMAGFLHRALVNAETRLPTPTKAHFRDSGRSAFDREIEELAEAGIVRGKTATSYQPAGTVTRGEMATLVRRAADYSLKQAGEPVLPPAPQDHFTDDAGSVHEPAINTVAATGLTGGYADGTFRPATAVPRDQMASFLARLLDVLVDAGVTTVPPAPGVQPTCDEALAVVRTDPGSFRAFADAWGEGSAQVGSPWRPRKHVVLRGVSPNTGDPVRETFDAGSGLRGDLDLDEEALRGDSPRRVLVMAQRDGTLTCRP